MYDQVIHEAHDDVPAVRDLTVTEILAQSSNIGAVTLGLEVGKDRLVEMISKFGFTEKLGIDFPGETAGVMPAEKWYGHHASPTCPSARASPSRRCSWRPPMRPSPTTACWCSPIWSRTQTEPLEPPGGQLGGGRPTAGHAQVTVEDGTGSGAGEGYEVAGKTGTAQKVNEDGSGYDEDRSSPRSWAWCRPMDPQLVILVMVDEPTTEHSGRLGGGSGVRRDRRLRPEAPGHPADRQRTKPGRRTAGVRRRRR